jgi:hypothetical protein
MPLPRPAAFAAAAPCLALCGCVSETPTGTGSTFKFEWWIPTLITVVALLGLIAGVLMIKRRKGGGWVFALAGVFGLIFGTGMFMDRAVVDDDHLDLHTGIIFTPTKHTVRFDDVVAIVGTAEEKAGRRGRTTTSYYLNFQLKSGGVQKVPLGDLMKNGAAAKVLAVAQKRGIPVAGIFPE